MDLLKSKLKKNKLTIGSWITLAHTAIAEIMAKAGFDWLVVDMEHSAIGLDQAQQLIQIIELSGSTPLVRVGENNFNFIKRVMDAGAHGVIVPMVNTKDDAQDAVSAVKYPPYGRRGVGLARAQGFGLDFNSYKKWNDKESIVIVQIEHIKALDSLEDILSVEGVDGFIVGPYDLSASLGVPGDFGNRRVIEALEEIMRVASRFKKSAGYHVVPPTLQLVKQKVSQGYTFIAFSADFLFLAETCRQQLKDIKKQIRQ